MPFSVEFESRDLRAHRLSLDARGGRRTRQFDDRLQADLGDLPIRCVICFEDCASEAG
jgi:hypothetical protein